MNINELIKLLTRFKRKQNLAGTLPISLRNTESIHHVLDSADQCSAREGHDVILLDDPNPNTYYTLFEQIHTKK